jgi:hypothetical protein
MALKTTNHISLRFGKLTICGGVPMAACGSNKGEQSSHWEGGSSGWIAPALRRTLTDFQRFRCRLKQIRSNRWPMIAAFEARRSRQRINLSEDYEIANWSRKWGVSHEQLAEAVQKAGPMSAGVAKLLGKEP